MDVAVSLQGVVKTFGPTRALDGLDLEARHGEVHGFLGPNGAGKTVTIRVLLGLLRPDGGSVELLGGDPWRGRGRTAPPGGLRARRRQPLAHSSPAARSSTCSAGCGAASTPPGATSSIDRFDLDLRRKARTYSKGNRQKVALVAALRLRRRAATSSTSPPSGLDPLMEAVFQDCVEELAAQGRTVLLSSHILARSSALRSGDHHPARPDRAVGHPGSELRHLTRTTVIGEHGPTGRGPATRCRRARPGGRGRPRAPSTSTATTSTTSCATSPGFGIRSLTSHPPTLEELFLRHYGDELSDAGLDADGTRDHRP